MVMLLIPVAIAINIVGGQLTTLLKLPIDLDMIGVILVGFLAGPIPVAVIGVLTNLINGIFAPTWIPYAFVSFFIGITAGLLAKYNMTNKVWLKVSTPKEIFHDSQLLETSMLKRPYISSIAYELGIDTDIINQEELIRFIKERNSEILI